MVRSRYNPNRLMHQILETGKERKRKRRSPRWDWWRRIKKIRDKGGKTLGEIKRLMLKHGKWKKWVNVYKLKI